MLMLSSLCGYVQADVVVVDSYDSYDLVTDALGIGNESFDFSTYDGSFTSVGVVTSSGTVEVSATSGLEGVRAERGGGCAAGPWTGPGSPKRKNRKY